ncbi:hypothetical protein [Actinoplanes couchii]|uniref:Uncharacterized protein n=1 Tax=Actinoplanes couchii TaxID=403638 RepID=A0ABQ3XGY4_9ACTN|nr:hypothetical protein [Actinoplanes couchii]MDR6320841.1 hypothetical protein [Actinoplanes couchii]GID57675.1 hypothetical protein Aco03nite_060790 [Actinoplanes couchii]
MDRWSTVLDHLASALPYGGRMVLIEGSSLVADRLADRIRDRGLPCVRLSEESETWRDLTAGAVVIADGPGWRERLPSGDWDLSVRVRTSREHPHDEAHVVMDLHDPEWPVIRHMDPLLVPGDFWYRIESRAFFATRAATWDSKFGSDLPAYASAMAPSPVAARRAARRAGAPGDDRGDRLGAADIRGRGVPLLRGRGPQVMLGRFR